MQCPKVVLSILRSKSTEENYTFRRLYRNLYNPEFFLLAYENLSTNDGALTPGIDDRTIDGFSLKDIDNVIATLKDKSYQPYPSKRVYIAKKNGKKRPLGLPSFYDKIIQEVIRMILEAIYEKHFSNSSHAYQQEKSCHSALQEIKHTFTGSKWFIEGDIKGFFDNINHRKMIHILRKTIDDEPFLDLIWKFLRAGYLEEWQFHKTYSGAPQGGIISPVLSNIYLNEFDAFMHGLANQYSAGTKRKRHPQSKKLEYQRGKLRSQYKKARTDGDEHRKEQIKAQLQTIERENFATPYADPMDDGYKRLSYTRYADDFLVGIIGSKEDAQQLKEAMARFLNHELLLEMSFEKTLITHASHSHAEFLGYDIRVINKAQPQIDKRGRKSRMLNGKVQLKMPHHVWVNKLKKYQAIKMHANGDWKAKARGYFQRNEDIEILSQYNSEIRGLYNYYRLAENVSNHMHRFSYFMYYSLLKSFAMKYRTGTKQIRQTYMRHGRFTVEYETSKGIKHMRFIDRSFPRSKSDGDQDSDCLPNTSYVMSSTRLSDRIKAKQCESCKVTEIDVHMHHVKRLKNLRQKSNKSYLDQQMIARNRKTIALCKKCHVKRHKGEI